MTRMMNTVWCWTLLYWMFALAVVFPPEEAVSAGITVEALLGSWIGSEMTGFIQYHIRRTCATLLAHCLLLPGKF